MSKKQINPYQFIYKPGTEVTIPGELLSNLMSFMNHVVDSNTEVYYTDKFKFINTETEKEVKTPKQEDLDSGKVLKIVDVENTIKSAPKFYRNATALEAVKLNMRLQASHLKAIEDGKAVNYEDLEKEQEQKESLIIQP